MLHPHAETADRPGETVGIFDKPDFERMLARGDWPRVVHYANDTKHAELSALAMKAATRDLYRLVEYLYETAVWTQKNSSNRGRRLPGRGIRQINDATNLLVRVGAPSVRPLVESVRAYDDYGEPDEDARVLYFTIVIDVLQRLGARGANGLRELARVRDESIANPAGEALQRLVDRGLIKSTGLPA
jgi:hypothetical protein